MTLPGLPSYRSRGLYHRGDMIIVLLALVAASPDQSQAPSADAIKRAVFAAYDHLGGLSLQYEGRAYRPLEKGPTELGREILNFSGLLSVGSSHNALAVEIL